MTGKKVFFGALGIFSTGVAILGVWLPGIPTTFPLIVALWSFSKSSDKLHAWVGSLPVLKQALKEAERFERERSIDGRIKLIAIASAWVSAVAVIVLTHNIMLSAFVVFSALACTSFMMYIPTRQRSLIEVEAED